MSDPTFDETKTHTYEVVMVEDTPMWRYPDGYTEVTLWIMGKHLRARDYGVGAKIRMDFHAYLVSPSEPTFQFGDDT